MTKRFQYADNRQDSHQRAGRAADLRARSTPPEAILWKALRALRASGLKFRRQHPVGPYILDFYCHEAALCVEIDGETHLGRALRDQERDASLAALGIRTIRFSASDVARSCDAVVARIIFELSGKAPVV